MAKKILQVVETAYRGTIEEQDDAVVWLTHAMKGAGAELELLLRGNAVNYAVKGQDASGLAFGERKQTQPARLFDDVAKLIGKGVAVHIVEEDLGERGLEKGELIGGLSFVARSKVPELMARCELVFHW